MRLKLLVIQTDLISRFTIPIRTHILSHFFLHLLNRYKLTYFHETILIQTELFSLFTIPIRTDLLSRFILYIDLHIYCTDTNRLIFTIYCRFTVPIQTDLLSRFTIPIRTDSLFTIYYHTNANRLTSYTLPTRARVTFTHATYFTIYILLYTSCYVKQKERVR